MGSPSVNPATGGKEDGTSNNGGPSNTNGFSKGEQGVPVADGRPLAPLRNVPIPRQPSNVQAEASSGKKTGTKSSATRPPKELDVNGQPIKKPRQKRAPKQVEEVSIYFRVKSMAE